jgi:alpha-N-acetylglucosamine transferase
MKLLLQKKILLIFLILGVSLGYSQGIETFSNVPTNSPTS